eukprot:UN05387
MSQLRLQHSYTSHFAFVQPRYQKISKILKNIDQFADFHLSFAKTVIQYFYHEKNYHIISRKEDKNSKKKKVYMLNVLNLKNINVILLDVIKYFINNGN